MPRNADGVYTLPDSNPVEAGATITSKWANETFEDVADALTQSLPKTGGTITGALMLHADPIEPLQASTKQYVDGATGDFVQKSGDTLTGFLTAHAQPTADMHMSTKKYVDDQVDQVSAGVANFGDYTITMLGTTLQFKYKGTLVMSLTSTGILTAKDDIKGFTAP